MSEEKNIHTEKQNKKFNLARIIALSLVGAFLLFYIVCQVVISSRGRSVTTEIALADSAVKSVSAEMFIVRDEKIITASGNNIVSAVSDGARVSAYDTVAYSFSDPTAAGNIVRMAEVRNLLNYYSGLINKSSVVVNDTTAYDNRIIGDIYDFAAMVSSGNFTSLSDEKNDLRDAITSKQTATGVKLDLSGTISALQSEYSALQSSASSYTEIKSGGSGYYISGTDGYENVLNYKDVDEWTIGDVEAALSAEPVINPGGVGRIVHGYYWYLACVTDTNRINGLREGNRRMISIPDSSIADFSAQVYSIRSDHSSGKSLIIFRCILMNEDFASLRRESAKINIETFEGYRVDNKAIRVNEDNETGVYVLAGSVMNFKKVEIVYSTDDYSIVINPFLNDVTQKHDYLNLYDEYIIDGRDLYDGKMIK